MPEHTKDRAEQLYAACERAGCTGRQLEVMRLRLSGLTQVEIAASLQITQPAAAIHIARAKRRLVAHIEALMAGHQMPPVALPRGFDRLIEFYGWLWHTICGDVHEDGILGGWRRQTIGAGPAFDPLTDPEGNPVHFRVRPYRPEDSVEEAQQVGACR